MPRHPRLFLPYAIYHVYCRVARGEFIFDDDSEAMEFVERMREVRDLDGWSILAWCLMGNHYHLFVKTRDVELWRSMARLQARVSRFGFRGRDVAALLGKHGNSVTKWLTQGLRLERDDPDFKNRLDRIDASISSSG